MPRRRDTSVLPEERWPHVRFAWAERLRAKLAERQVTPEAVAQAVGVSGSMVREMAAGKRKGTVEMQTLIADYLAIDPAVIWPRNDAEDTRAFLVDRAGTMAKAAADVAAAWAGMNEA